MVCVCGGGAHLFCAQAVSQSPGMYTEKEIRGEIPVQGHTLTLIHPQLPFLQTVW